MRAMILAAGLGTRLRPLTHTMPKPLLPLDGVPLIVWNLLLLRQAGIREVIINLHHLGDQIEKALGDGSRSGMQLVYSREPILLGTGGGIRQARWFFGDQPFLVINGDTVVEMDLAGLVRRHDQGRMAGNAAGPAATLVVRDDADVERWGVLELCGDQIVRINGRGRPDQGIKPLARRMFAGVHVLDPTVLRHLPPEGPASIIEAYVAELESGGCLLGYPLDGYWSDVGTPERYREVQDDVKRGLIDLRARL